MANPIAFLPRLSRMQLNSIRGPHSLRVCIYGRRHALYGCSWPIHYSPCMAAPDPYTAARVWLLLTHTLQPVYGCSWPIHYSPYMAAPDPYTAARVWLLLTHTLQPVYGCSWPIHCSPCMAAPDPYTAARVWLLLTHTLQPVYGCSWPILLLLLLLLKEVGSARLREGDIHPISPKAPAPQYQPINIKKKKKKIVEDYSTDRAAEANRKHWPWSWNPPVPHHRIRGQQDRSRRIYWEGKKSPAVLRGSAARRRISISMCDQRTAL